MAAPNTSKSITNINIPMMPPLVSSLFPVLEGTLFFAGGLLLEGALLGAFDGVAPCFAKGDWVTLEGAVDFFAGGPPTVWGFLIPPFTIGAFDGGVGFLFATFLIDWGAFEGAEIEDEALAGAFVRGWGGALAGVGLLSPAFAGGAGALDGVSKVLGPFAIASFLVGRLLLAGALRQKGNL